jgi:hypothetical protein
MNRIDLTPAHEFEILANTVVVADRMAGRGELVDGHGELVYGLRRAELLEGDRVAGASLALGYLAAILDYSERWAVALR